MDYMTDGMDGIDVKSSISVLLPRSPHYRFTFLPVKVRSGRGLGAGELSIPATLALECSERVYVMKELAPSSRVPVDQTSRW